MAPSIVRSRKLLRPMATMTLPKAPMVTNHTPAKKALVELR
jgi:hypothetical protein